MALFCECETEYRSKNGLSSSKSEITAFILARYNVFDMKCSDSRPVEQFYDQKWPINIQKFTDWKMADFRGCETEYRSEKGLLPS